MKKEEIDKLRNKLASARRNEVRWRNNCYELRADMRLLKKKLERITKDIRPTGKGCIKSGPIRYYKGGKHQ